MNWTAGDKAKVIGSVYLGCVYIGAEVEVVNVTERHIEVNVPPSPYKTTGHEWASFFPEHLKPIYDGNETTTWEEIEKICGYKPKELVPVLIEEEL